MFWDSHQKPRRAGVRKASGTRLYAGLGHIKNITLPRASVRTRTVKLGSGRHDGNRILTPQAYSW
jgi:hypothetical protein